MQDKSMNGERIAKKDTAHAVPNFLAGGGEMGARIRAFDWSATPLGPPRHWPQALRTAIRIALTARHPASVFWGADGISIYNDSFSRMMGSEPHRSALGTPGRAVWAETWNMIGPQVAQVMSGGGAAWLEGQHIPFVRRDGAERADWNYGFSPIDDDASPGGIGGVLVLCSEMTARFGTAEQLTLERTRLSTLVDTAPGFIAVLRGPDHVVDVANQAFTRLLGERDIMGRPLRENLPEMSAQSLADSLDGVFRTGKGFTGRAMPVDVRSCPNGTLERRYVDFVQEPMREADGTISGILLQGLDVTEQTKTQRQLRETLQVNAALLDNVGEGIIGLDADGCIMFDNPVARNLLGYDEGELTGCDAHGSFHHHCADGMRYPAENCPIGATLKDGKRRHIADEVFFRKNGTPFFVDYTVAPITNGDTAKGPSCLVIFRDLTQLRSETRLRDLEADTLRWISEGVELDLILRRMAQQIGALIPGMYASISLVEGERLRIVAADGLPTEYIAAMDDIPIREGIQPCAAAVARAQQIISNDIETDPLWVKHGPLAKHHGLAACWSTPVVDPQGDVMATFALYAGAPRSPSRTETDVIGRIGRLLGLAINHWRQSDTLRRSEAYYRAIFDMLPVGFWEEDWTDLIPMLRALRDSQVADFDAYFAANPDFVDRAINAVRPLRANSASAEMFAATSGEDLIAKKDMVIATANARETFCRAMAACLRGDWQFGYEVSTIDLEGERLDYLLRMSVPSLDGGDPRAVLTEMDVTALNRANERFRTVAHATRDVIWDTDLLTQEVWASDGLYRLFGIDPNTPDLSRETWSRRLHPDDRDRVIDIQRTAVDGDAPGWSAEYRFRRASDEYAVVRDQATILRDDAGNAVRMIGSMIDVTSEREMQEQLRQAQRLEAVGQLTGGVAHDFNNLLTVIVGCAEILADDLADRPEAYRLASSCLTAAERGAELTNRLLAFARKQPLKPVDTDVTCIVAGIENLLGRTLGGAIELTIEETVGVCAARLDPGQLEVALINLAVNARDAMPDGGRLTFATANRTLGQAEARSHDVAPGAYVCITVADTGTGMDRDVARRAFEPFFTTKEFGKGSGLGLSLVYGFARQSGGFATIDSTPGVGTTVTLCFPRTHWNTALQQT